MALTAAPSTGDTRLRILDSAFESIRDMGLGRTTMEDVARTAGVSRQTVYRYFPSKDHLILALVLREEDRFLTGVRTAFSENDTGVRMAVSYALAPPSRPDDEVARDLARILTGALTGKTRKEARR